jgi:hypothetical protein
VAGKSDLAYENAVTELTGAEPDKFIARRKELAQELRQAGDRSAAATVLGIRKPSATVALANKVARYDPERVEALLTAGRQLQSAQESVFAGTSGASDLLRAASASFQRALDRVATQSAKMPGSRATTEPVRRQLRDLLAAAALGPREMRDALARGRMLTEPLPLGFGGLSAMPEVAEGESATEPATRAQPATPKRNVEAERRANRLAAAREHLNAAHERAREAEAHAAKVEMEARRAEAEAVRLRRDAGTARSRAEERRRAADKVAAELDQLK